MTIWTCKGAKGAVAACALITLAACEGGQGGALFDGIGSIVGAAPAAAGKPVALSQANMAFGAVTLVAPTGFCIDKGSLKQNFALMVRCDALGAVSAAGDAPFGVLTASFSAASDTLPTPQDTALAHDLDAVTDALAKDGSVTFRAKGTAPAQGLSGEHWRATARIGPQMMGLALFGPPQGRIVGTEGRAILVDFIDKLNANVAD